MIVKEKIDTQRAENQGKKSGDVTDEVGGDFDGKESPDEENAGEIGGMSHATQKSRSTILLPDGKKGPAEIFLDIKLGMEIVPAGKEGAGLEVEKDEKASDEEKSDNRPKTGKKFFQVT